MIRGQPYTATLAELELWPAVADLLAQHGISTVYDLAIRDRYDLLAIKGMGTKKIAEIEAHLNSIEVRLGELKEES